jgi:hypothetical protein
VTAITPATGERGEPVVATIGGTNFQNSAQVTIEGIRDVQEIDFQANAIEVTFSIDDEAALGPRDVTVTNPDGRSDTLPDGFTIELPDPEITAVDPEFVSLNNDGLMVTVTIEGSNFAPGVTADFGADIDVEVIGTVGEESFQVRLTLTSAAATGQPRDVTVTVGGKMDILENAFTVSP